MKVNYIPSPFKNNTYKKNLCVLLLYNILPYYQNYVETYTYTLLQKGWILYGSPCTRNYRGISILLPHTYGTPNYYIHHHHIIKYPTLPLPHYFVQNNKKNNNQRDHLCLMNFNQELVTNPRNLKDFIFCHFKKNHQTMVKKINSIKYTTTNPAL